MSLPIVAVSAGLSQPSSTRLLLDRLADAVQLEAAAHDLAVDVSVVELRPLAHEITDHLLTGFPSPRLAAVLDQVASAAGLVVVTPTFSASYSGLFKSFFDVMDPDALVDKPVLVAATGGSARHSLVLDYAVRPLLSYFKARPLPTGVFAATADFGSDTGGALDGRIAQAASELTAALGARSTEPLTRRFRPGRDELRPEGASFEELLRAARAVGDTRPH